MNDNDNLTTPFEHYTIKTRFDQEPDNPRDWDNVCHMIFFHKRYVIGDKHSYNSGNYRSFEEMEADVCKQEQAAYCRVVYMYDHGGVALSMSRDYPFNDQWDAGVIGLIIISKESAKECGVNTKEKAEKIMNEEVQVYSDYLSGQVYSTTVVDDHDMFIDQITTYGYEATEEARSTWLSDYTLKEEEAMSNALVSDVVPD